MEKYNVTGMSCAACSARVEKAVSKVDGVTSCSVSLLTNSMGVEGSASASEIIKAVVDAGYGASLVSGTEKTALEDKNDTLEDTETPKIAKRLIASIIFLLPLMYVSMGHMMWNWPVPAFLKDNKLSIGIYELLLSAVVMIINQKFFISGFKGLIHKAPNMDTLVALGSSASFLYSVYSLFVISSITVKGGNSDFTTHLYFESAAMILTLITVGKLLESKSKGQTTNALKSLMKLSPKTAVLLKDGKETVTKIDQVCTGDIFIVKPGMNIPVDGIVIEGSSSVDESALTGESIPVDKIPEDNVSAGTINVSGFLKCRALKVGNDTTLAQIIQMVSDAAATKAPIAKIADKVSGIFVPAVISIAVLTFIAWMIAGQTFAYALSRAISVLVISCPCSLGLATPVAIMAGNGKSAKNGILFKTAASMEETGKIQIIALDKTGTITKGKTEVVKMQPLNGYSEATLLTLAYALEQKSEHPLAKAIVEKAMALGFKDEPVQNFESLSGKGITGLKNGIPVAGGKLDFIANYAEISDEAKKDADNMAEQGFSPLFFAEDGKLAGIIAVADSIKEDSAEAIQELKNMGIHVVMLTGENKKTAEKIGKEAGVDEVVSEVLPDGKESVIKLLKEKGKVCMVGDGINDAPALTSADTGIAIGKGTDVAIDAADVIVVKGSLKDVAAAVRISRKTLTNIHENLFWAFFYNAIGIPLAAGAWVHLLGWELNPMFGAAAMSLSSFCVVSNALRLNLIKPYNAKHDRKNKKSLGNEPLLANLSKSEEKNMTVKVKGMMCSHCEMHVKQAIEKIEGVSNAVADHEKGTVTIETTGNVSIDAVKAAVTEAGYEFEGEC